MVGNRPPELPPGMSACPPELPPGMSACPPRLPPGMSEEREARTTIRSTSVQPDGTQTTTIERIIRRAASNPRVRLLAGVYGAGRLIPPGPVAARVLWIHARPHALHTPQRTITPRSCVSWRRRCADLQHREHVRHRPAVTCGTPRQRRQNGGHVRRDAGVQSCVEGVQECGAGDAVGLAVVAHLRCHGYHPDTRCVLRGSAARRCTHTPRRRDARLCAPTEHTCAHAGGQRPLRHCLRAIDGQHFHRN